MNPANLARSSLSHGSLANTSSSSVPSRRRTLRVVLSAQVRQASSSSTWPRRSEEGEEENPGEDESAAADSTASTSSASAPPAALASSSSSSPSSIPPTLDPSTAPSPPSDDPQTKRRLAFPTSDLQARLSAPLVQSNHAPAIERARPKRTRQPLVIVPPSASSSPPPLTENSSYPPNSGRVDAARTLSAGEERRTSSRESRIELDVRESLSSPLLEPSSPPPPEPSSLRRLRTLRPRPSLLSISPPPLPKLSLQPRLGPSQHPHPRVLPLLPVPPARSPRPPISTLITLPASPPLSTRPSPVSRPSISDLLSSSAPSSSSLAPPTFSLPSVVPSLPSPLPPPEARTFPTTTLPLVSPSQPVSSPRPPASPHTHLLLPSRPKKARISEILLSPAPSESDSPPTATIADVPLPSSIPPPVPITISSPAPVPTSSPSPYDLLDTPPSPPISRTTSISSLLLSPSSATSLLSSPPSPLTAPVPPPPSRTTPSPPTASVSPEISASSTSLILGIPSSRIKSSKTSTSNTSVSSRLLLPPADVRPAHESPALDMSSSSTPLVSVIEPKAFKSRSKLASRSRPKLGSKSRPKLAPRPRSAPTSKQIVLKPAPAVISKPPPPSPSASQPSPPSAALSPEASSPASVDSPPPPSRPVSPPPVSSPILRARPTAVHQPTPSPYRKSIDSIRRPSIPMPSILLDRSPQSTSTPQPPSVSQLPTTDFYIPQKPAVTDQPSHTDLPSTFIDRWAPHPTEGVSFSPSPSSSADPNPSTLPSYVQRFDDLLLGQPDFQTFSTLLSGMGKAPLASPAYAIGYPPAAFSSNDPPSLAVLFEHSLARARADLIDGPNVMPYLIRRFTLPADPSIFYSLPPSQRYLQTLLPAQALPLPAPQQAVVPSFESKSTSDADFGLRGSTSDILASRGDGLNDDELPSSAHAFVPAPVQLAEYAASLNDEDGIAAAAALFAAPVLPEPSVRFSDRFEQFKEGRVMQRWETVLELMDAAEDAFEMRSVLAAIGSMKQLDGRIGQELMDEIAEAFSRRSIELECPYLASILLSDSHIYGITPSNSPSSSLFYLRDLLNSLATTYKSKPRRSSLSRPTMPGPGRAALDWLLPLLRSRLAGDPIGTVLLLDAARVFGDVDLARSVKNDLLNRTERRGLGEGRTNKVERWEKMLGGKQKLDRDESAWVLATLDELNDGDLYEVFTPLLSPDLAFHRDRVADLAHSVPQFRDSHLQANQTRSHILAALGPSTTLHYTDPLVVLYSLRLYLELPQTMPIRQAKLAELFSVCKVFASRWAGKVSTAERKEIAREIARYARETGKEKSSLRRAFEEVVGDVEGVSLELDRHTEEGRRSLLLEEQKVGSEGSEVDEKDGGRQGGEEDSMAKWKDAWRLGTKARSSGGGAGVGGNVRGGTRSISSSLTTKPLEAERGDDPTALLRPDEGAEMGRRLWGEEERFDRFDRM